MEDRETVRGWTFRLQLGKHNRTGSPGRLGKHN